MFARSLTAAIALSLIAAPAALHAGTEHEPVSVTIKVSDLDPASTADQAKYEARLKAAARAACRTGINSTWARAEEQRCLEEFQVNGANWAN